MGKVQIAAQALKSQPTWLINSHLVTVLDNQNSTIGVCFECLNCTPDVGIVLSKAMYHLRNILLIF